MNITKDGYIMKKYFLFAMIAAVMGQPIMQSYAVEGPEHTDTATSTFIKKYIVSMVFVGTTVYTFARSMKTINRLGPAKQDAVCLVSMAVAVLSTYYIINKFCTPYEHAIDKYAALSALLDPCLSVCPIATLIAEDAHEKEIILSLEKLYGNARCWIRCMDTLEQAKVLVSSTLAKIDKLRAVNLDDPIFQKMCDIAEKQLFAIVCSAKKVEQVVNEHTNSICDGRTPFVPYALLFDDIKNDIKIGKGISKLIAPSLIKDTFDSVAGAAEAKEDLKDVVEFLKNPEKYEQLGAKMRRGILLTGAPGNGKTLLARAVAGEAKCSFFSVSGSEFDEVYVGLGASRVRDLFAQARQHAPCIIFIDEIDAVGHKRNGLGTDGGQEQTLNQLLTEMDGFRTNAGPIVVIAATNRPDMLDQALLRPGRFDRHIEVHYPDLPDRVEILKVHIKSVTVDPKLDLYKIAQSTPGFSGADLANLVNEAALLACKNDQEFITMNDFDQAYDKISLGAERKSIVLSEKERKVTAYHESGHALARLLMPHDSDPLHKVTILPRGSSLGVTFSLPEHDKHSTTKREMLSFIMIALAGRAAEMLIFDEETTGASSDLLAATNVARKMVCDYGMSELGPVAYAKNVISPNVAEQIDIQIRKIIDECEQRTRSLLRENKDKLDILAKALLEKGTLHAGEIYKLLEIDPRADHQLL